MNHFITIADHSKETIQHILDVGLKLRAERERGKRNQPVLDGQTLAMIFEKPSLRTRVSFEQAMFELGGQSIVLDQSQVGLGKRESVADVTRVLCGMVQGIAARVFEHEKLEQMARHGDKPVINMLSDYTHPCQALADVMTMIDAFAPDTHDLTGRTLAFVGDGNNVVRSLAAICGRLGMNFVVASPGGYELEQAYVDRIMADSPNMNFDMTRDAKQAVRDADAIYTDTFVSMGQEAEKQTRLRAFEDYRLTESLLAEAPDHAIVLHCLPAYRGVEITDEVIDGPRSRVFPQAHNRLHAQKGLLAVLMGGQ
ncbi:ornithine carbamoyltransferase [Phycisphaerales bacterium AB-hyl4]|uniref:Ornithine carbamoyltransferase n=1 Tax=Natronomicrosphaera hydrolytica TaxID=3242702 RepID=A0ABV4U7C0_9BACT